MRKLLLFGTLALLGATFVACSDDDPGLVTPPEVEVKPNSVTGIITDMQGKAIEGATVNVGAKTATTDKDGIYTVEDVAAGTYKLAASATGMVSTEGTLVVEQKAITQTLIWNATLAKINTTDVNVTVNNGGEGSVESEALEGNDEGKVDISVEVPANVVPEDTKVSITPLYSDETNGSAKAIKSRALLTYDELLIGATVTCSNPNLQLSQDIQLKFAVDNTVSTGVVTKKLVNGTWVEVPSQVVGENVVISTRDLNTSYGIFRNISINETVSKTALTFTPQSEWNNLYGNKDITVGTVYFNYNVGTHVALAARNNLQGLLIQALARYYGASYRATQGAYPINTRIPVGTALSISGDQQNTKIVATCSGVSVEATKYGDVTVQVTTFNRDHNGGASN